jgi:hypothetical protein
VIILVAWITKIFLHAKPQITSIGSFYKALHVGTSIPSWLVALMFVSTFLSVIGIVLYIGRKTTGGDFGVRHASFALALLSQPRLSPCRFE